LRTSTTYKSFVCIKTLSSFRQKTSFSQISALFPLAGSYVIALLPPFETAFRGPSQPSFDNQYRLSRAGFRVKEKAQKKAQSKKGRYQASGVRSGGLAAEAVRILSTLLALPGLQILAMPSQVVAG
jgi:hypothetical protein